MDIYCEEHPEYEGDNEPTYDCEKCWEIYEEMNGPTEVDEDIMRWEDNGGPTH